MANSDDSLLGQANQYTVGDRQIEIGWRRSSDVMRQYMRRPRGYITTATTGRGVEKGARDVTPAGMRKLAADLNTWADTLERHQAAWDAREAHEKVA